MAAKMQASKVRSDKGSTHKGFTNFNRGKYKQPDGKVSGFCQSGKCKKCLSLACCCPCHEE